MTVYTVSSEQLLLLLAVVICVCIGIGIGLRGVGLSGCSKHFCTWMCRLRVDPMHLRPVDASARTAKETIMHRALLRFINRVRWLVIIYLLDRSLNYIHNNIRWAPDDSIAISGQVGIYLVAVSLVLSTMVDVYIYAGQIRLRVSSCQATGTAEMVELAHLICTFVCGVVWSLFLPIVSIWTANKPAFNVPLFAVISAFVVIITFLSVVYALIRIFHICVSPTSPLRKLVALVYELPSCVAKFTCILAVVTHGSHYFTMVFVVFGGVDFVLSYIVIRQMSHIMHWLAGPEAWTIESHLEVIGIKSLPLTAQEEQIYDEERAVPKRRRRGESGDGHSYTSAVALA